MKAHRAFYGLFCVLAWMRLSIWANTAYVVEWLPGEGAVLLGKTMRNAILLKADKGPDAAQALSIYCQSTVTQRA